MSRLATFGVIEKTLKANETIPLELSRGADLSAQNYVLDITINHTNASALSVSDYAFAQNLIKHINFEAGAGQKIIDLPMRDMMIRELLTRGTISATIDKTSTGAKVSRIRLTIDMSLVRFLNPKDGLFQTWKYGHRVINILGGAWDGVANCTVDSASVRVFENFKKGAKKSYVQDSSGKAVEFNIMKKPVVKEYSIKGTTSDFEIKLPSSRKVTSMTIYAVDEAGLVVNGCVTNVELRNADKNIFSMPFETLNVVNRSNGVVKNQSSAYLNNIAFVDVAQGEIAQAIDTNIIGEEDTALYLSLDENGKTNPKVRVIFETITAS